MRVLLKRNSKYRLIFWIKRQKEFIVGSFYDAVLLTKTGTAMKRDGLHGHFTYPKDGNFHVTLNYKRNGKEIVERIFHDHIGIKGKGNIIRDDSEDFIFKHPLSTSVSFTKASPLADFESHGIFYSLANFYHNTLHEKNTNFRSEKIENQDIIVDLSDPSNKIVNINCFLAGKGIKGKYRRVECTDYLIDDKNYPFIYLIVNVRATW